MHRRAFLLSGGAALSLAALMPRSLHASEDWLEAFARARRDSPDLIGYDSVSRPELAAEMTVQGRLPAGLVGRLTRNGPAQHEVGGLRYHHWFDGDGMLQQFRFDGRGVSHHGRLVETAKVMTERAAGRAVEQGFGTALPVLRRPANPDAVNVANINAIEHGGRLLALWEAGSAWEIDRDTLATKGVLHWSAETAGLPFSAHPRIEPDGTLWNFGVLWAQQALLLYRIGADGRLQQAVSVPAPGIGMVHDFVVTARHIVVPMSPLRPDRARLDAGSAFLDSHVWHKDDPIRVLILPKDEPARSRIAELPTGFIYHYGNAWEDAAGHIRFDAAIYDDPSRTFETLRYVMRGESRPGTKARHAQVRIAPDGKTSIDYYDGSAEFPRIDPRRSGLRHRYTYIVSDTAVLRRDLETGALQRHDYGPAMHVEEHVFVPRPGAAGEGDGWLLGTVLDVKAGITRLMVLEASRLTDGPLAVASLPYVLPLGLHGSFAAA